MTTPLLVCSPVGSFRSAARAAAKEEASKKEKKRLNFCSIRLKFRRKSRAKIVTASTPAPTLYSGSLDLTSLPRLNLLAVSFP
ncbi:hypothetical protein Mapa_012445 [Marchantia paleacea]|nr:hypothetical protein Mapa_012445 [Marchantia paleacea]